MYQLCRRHPLRARSDKASQAGSNLPAVSSYYAGRDADIRAAYERMRQPTVAQARKRLSKRELRAAVDIVTRRRRRCYAASLASGRCRKREVTRTKFRRLIDRELAAPRRCFGAAGARPGGRQ